MKTFTIETFGEPIVVREDDSIEELGYWDEENGEIVIYADQPEAAKHLILLHELLHVAETAMKATGIIPCRVNHEFVTHAPPIVLTALVEAGLYTGVEYDDLMDFMKGEMEKEDE
jgi:hypothetical protein